MIIIVHKQNKLLQVLDEKRQPIVDFVLGETITETLKLIAEKFPEHLVIWCSLECLEYLNLDVFFSIFHHKRILASYNLSEKYYLPNQIGYIERSCFLNVNKAVSYPTWLMSSTVGGINTSVINNLKSELDFNSDFDYFLNSLAKRAMAEGLFCYSEPKLLKGHAKIKLKKTTASVYTLFKFVKQHYKWVWVFFLSASYFLYERRITFLPLFKSLFFEKLNVNFNLEKIPVQSTRNIISNRNVDVIIPTIGRKKYLYDVLIDLSKQTVLPKKVIIVEQNPNPNSSSELDYLVSENWPFVIKHIFTHQIGVCNARNLALEHVNSKWLFFADDDICFNSHLIEKTFEKLENYKFDIVSYLCLQPHQKQTFFKMGQTGLFGAGSSFCSYKAIENIKFNSFYEFGFGEDSDFGMQIRNKGYDVFFVPDIKITHLKAPIGGYRTKTKQLWDDDEIQPKPSPTIQLLNQTYFTKEQNLGYKLLLGLKNYKNSKIKSPVAYIRNYRNQWKRSEYWCSKIQSKN